MSVNNNIYIYFMQVSPLQLSGKYRIYNQQVIGFPRMQTNRQTEGKRHTQTYIDKYRQTDR